MHTAPKSRLDRGELNEVWTSDITYLSTDEVWLYLCAVRDGCSRRVSGWAVEDHMRKDVAPEMTPKSGQGCLVDLSTCPAQG
jgi:transposase InsO family protein